MSIPYLAEDDPVSAVEANAVFDRLDDAFRCLCNAQSPILYLGLSGTGSYQAAGMCGVVFVFGEISERVILAGISSHDQDTIDATVAAASTHGTQDDTRKQVGLDLTTGYLGNSLVTQTRLVTPGGGGADEPYFVRVPLLSFGGTDYYQHEHDHELAVAEVIFEGHTSRTFTWKAEWTKFRCIRLHNLTDDPEDLVVTMEATGDEITLPRWACKSVRLSADGLTWEEQGFLLFRMRDEDVERFGRTLPWNDRSAAIAAATYLSVWTADAANNVASFASVWRWLDWFSHANTPAEFLAECGGGVAEAFAPRTGFHFDLSNVTRNSYRLSKWPDPTDDDTLLYQLAWHGGGFWIYAKPDTGDATLTRTSATIPELLAGHAGSGLTLTIASGTTARLHWTSETGRDFGDLIPVGTNFGASGHPFSIPADGTGYTMPPITLGEPVLVRWSEAEVSETVAGIGTTLTTDYLVLDEENAADGALDWDPWDTTVGDVKSWTFGGGGVGNDHCTTMGNSVKWDGRRLAINLELELAPAGGACPSDDAVEALLGRSVIAELGKINLFQAATIQAWPPVGGIWLVREYRRRKIAQAAPSIYHPHTANPFGTSTGADWSGKDTTLFPVGDNVARQLPIPGNSGTTGVVSADLSDAFTLTQDSIDWILAHLSGGGPDQVTWWEANRADAISGDVMTDESRPVIAVPLMARHYNVLAQRINALSEICPFSFLDAIWWGRPFRPTYSGGIFGGHVYPLEFLCYATGDAETRADDLGVLVSDFATEYAAFAGYADHDLDSVLPEDPPFSHPEAFRVSGAGGINLWNTDAPLWFNINAAVTQKEPTVVAKVSEGYGGLGYTQGELAGQFGSGEDWYWWWLPNDAAFDFPDFQYLTVGNVKAAADSLGIPFFLVRLATWLELTLTTPDDPDGFGMRKSRGAAVMRQDLRLIPAYTRADFEAYAGTGEAWAPSGLVRVSDWPVYPGANGTSDVGVQRGNASPMQNLDRGDGREPYAWNALSIGLTSWRNSDPFSGEAPHVTPQVWDSIPTPPTGFQKWDQRLATYPVPMTEWGATDIETHPAPDVPFKAHRLSDFAGFITAENLWEEAGGSGAWSGEGGFGVHLLPAGIRPT